MTKKHFEALAAALEVNKPSDDAEEGIRCYWETICADTADVCARFNPHFDRARFLKACGVEESR